MERSKLTLPCDTCGENMFFKQAEQVFTCSSCGSLTFPLQMNAEFEESDYSNLLALIEKQTDKVEEPIAECRHCKTVFISDGNKFNGKCPYCKDIIYELSFKNIMIPQYIIPFSLSEEHATQYLTQWLKRRSFLPFRLKKQIRANALNAVYLPFWFYKCAVDTSYTGQRGEYYYSFGIEHPGHNQPHPKKTRWKDVSRSIKHDFTNFIAPASRIFPAIDDNVLQNYDPSMLEPYNAAHLQDAFIESYSLSPTEGFESIKYLLEQFVTYSLKSDIGGDEQVVTSCKINYNDINLKYVLLPFWVANYQNKAACSHFFVNAVTGKVHGKRPYAKSKLLTSFLNALKK